MEARCPARQGTPIISFLRFSADLDNQLHHLNRIFIVEKAECDEPENDKFS